MISNMCKFSILTAHIKEMKQKKNCIMLIKWYFIFLLTLTCLTPQILKIFQCLLISPLSLSLSSFIRKLEDFFAFPLYIFFYSFIITPKICSENISGSASNQQNSFFSTALGYRRVKYQRNF